MKKIYNSMIEMIGHTPLVHLNLLQKKHHLKANILAKCEFYNPLFSVKDRAALFMIEKVEKEGKVSDKTIFLEATSGNTGIALAAICAAKGYKLVITMPENMTKERIALMRHFGAEVILTPKEDGMKGALAKAEMLAEKNPDVIMLQQFCNEANVDAHKFGTSIEILEDTGGDIDALVCAVGTSGTLSGIVTTLKTSNPDLYVVAVEPKASSVLSGGKAGQHDIPGIGAGFVPKFYDAELVDEVIAVEDADAWKTAAEVASVEGLPAGISGGAALWAAINLAKRNEMKGKNIVMILPDSINNYLSRL